MSKKTFRDAQSGEFITRTRAEKRPARSVAETSPARIKGHVAMISLVERKAWIEVPLDDTPKDLKIADSVSITIKRTKK